MWHATRLTEKALRAVQSARREAGAMGSTRIVPEHLLLGILAVDPAAVRQFLSKDADDPAEKELRQQAGKGPVKIADNVDLALSPESKNVLRLAAESARVRSHRHIDTADLVAGVVRDQRILASQILHKYRGYKEST